MLVPQSALIVDQQGTYVFTVVEGKAVVARVKLGGECGPDAIINDGLKGGEQVVVQGMESLRPARRVASPAPPPLSRGLTHVLRHLHRPAAAGDGYRHRHDHRGVLSLLVIPIAQYPDIVPPQVSVTTTYPGASAAVVECNRRAADRKPDRRRRQDDLHEERQRQ